MDKRDSCLSSSAGSFHDPTDDEESAEALVIPISPMAKEEEVKERHSLSQVVSVVAFYNFASISTILLNKTVLNSAGIPSLLFLWCQLCLAVLLLHLAQLFGLLQLPRVNLEAFRQLAGLVGINVVGLALNTMCLANIDAILYQVARSLILPMTVAMSPFVTGTRASLKVLLACGLIFSGFIIGIFGETRTSTATSSMDRIAVSPAGIVFGILSSLSTSCHSFIIKGSYGRVQSKYSASTFDLVYYNNLFSAILLLPMVALLEWEQVMTFIHLCRQQQGTFQSFILGTALSGASGLLINLAGFLQIKVTSPVTHTVSSAARGVLQSLAARVLLGEDITPSRCAGIGITLAGSCLYSWFKAQENNYKSI